MYQKLPVNSLEWVQETSQFNEDFSKNYNEETDEGIFQKAAEATGDLIGNENGDLVTRASKTSPKIMQKQMKKKYLGKSIYHQHYHKTLLMT